MSTGSGSTGKTVTMGGGSRKWLVKTSGQPSRSRKSGEPHEAATPCEKEADQEPAAPTSAGFRQLMREMGGYKNKEIADIDLLPSVQDSVAERAKNKSQGSTRTTQDTEPLAPWQCTECTFVNQNADHLACEMCGIERKFLPEVVLRV
eukprot:TRINITY_DN84181_c0_g1_i1.p1 TRINITY_DN84181_c0_g1~~TRINITY_DN84181_c0_g1_i1.p1  ORF type:complete len:148 (+),score=19.15 TRINITY_DN84181_c0_g1_i1:132-575(+)